MVLSDDSQKDVLAFLSNPKSYGQEAPIERHETHGAIVFLAGDRAYKLKRSVRFAYMDYSSPERRREMCGRELAVNRRTAPEIYIGIQSIVRDGRGKLHFGAPNDPAAVEWVVVMRRFDQDNLLEQMRQKGRLTAQLFRVLAEAIAQFHQQAEIRRGYGGGDGIAAIIAENAAVLKTLTGRPFGALEIERFSTLSEKMLTRSRPLLDDRLRQGKVRRCHGDLHLNNICLIDDQPVLFDAIEFSEEFACIDVLYDLAFLLMDLDRHGLHEYANIVLNRYFELSADYEGVATLPLFLSCRAAIRAHVSATTAGFVAQDQARSKLQEAAQLLDRAVGYLDPAAPQLLAIGGASGTGKSTLARNLAPLLGPAPGAMVIRSDVMRKHLLGVSETTRLPVNAYQPPVNRKVYDTIFASASKILTAGHAVIADAVFGHAEEQEYIAQVATDAKVKFQGLWLEADSGLLQKRLVARVGDASDATADVLLNQLKFIQRPQDWLFLDASGSAAQIAVEARQKLGLPPTD